MSLRCLEFLPQYGVFALIVFADRIEFDDLVPMFTRDVSGVMLDRFAAIFASGWRANDDVEVGKDRDVGQRFFRSARPWVLQFLLLWE